MSTLALGFPLEGERVRLESDRPDSAAVIVRLSDRAPVGTIAFETAHTTLTIQSFCIDAAGAKLRLWLGGRVALCSGRRSLRLRTRPGLGASNLGLAVYFWFRMGFHPLHGEGPEGGIWLELELG